MNAGLDSGVAKSNSMVSTWKISLGDLVQKTAVSVHKEMDEIRLSLKSKDPELRTVSLRAFVSKTMKKLAQLYAICNWVDSPGVVAFFDSISTLHTQIMMIETQLTEVQDRLYWAHNMMFSLRSRPLEIQVASEVLSSGTYHELPLSIFSCGKTIEPGIEFKLYTEEQKKKMLEEMNVFIRAKLALNDQIPCGLTHVQLGKGFLLMRVNDAYEVTVSLDHLHERAHWVVLSVHILTESHADEQLEGGYEHETLERDTLLVLRKHAAAARDSTAELERIETEINENCIEKCASNDKEGETEKNVNFTTKSSVEMTKKILSMNKFTLQHVHAICMHVALGTVQRLMYVQALDMSRSLWRGRLEVEFVDEISESVCTFRFWKSCFSDSFQYQLRIKQVRPRKEFSVESSKAKVNVVVSEMVEESHSKKRKVGESFNQKVEGSDKRDICNNNFLGFPLKAEILVPRKYGTEDREHQSQENFVSVPQFAALQDCELSEHWAGGVSFRSCFDSVLETLATLKINLLRVRLLKSVAFINGISSGMLTVREDDIGLVIILQGLKLSVCVDAQSGDYIAKLSNSCGKGLPVRSGTKEGLKQFLLEVNNLDTQAFVRELLLDINVVDRTKSRTATEQFDAYIRNPTSNFKIKALVTAESLIQSLVLSSWEALAKFEAKISKPSGNIDIFSLIEATEESVLPRHIIEAAGITGKVSEYCVAKYALPSQLKERMSDTYPNFPFALGLNLEELQVLENNKFHASSTNSGGFSEGVADIGIFIVLSTCTNLVSKAHLLLCSFACTVQEDYSGNQRAIIREEMKEGLKAGIGKKKKKNVHLTAGQIAALREKEEKERQDEEDKIQQEDRERAGVRLQALLDISKTKTAYNPTLLKSMPLVHPSSEATLVLHPLILGTYEATNEIPMDMVENSHGENEVSSTISLLGVEEGISKLVDVLSCAHTLCEQWLQRPIDLTTTSDLFSNLVVRNGVDFLRTEVDFPVQSKSKCKLLFYSHDKLICQTELSFLHVPENQNKCKPVVESFQSSNSSEDFRSQAYELIEKVTSALRSQMQDIDLQSYSLEPKVNSDMKVKQTRKGCNMHNDIASHVQKTISYIAFNSLPLLNILDLVENQSILCSSSGLVKGTTLPLMPYLKTICIVSNEVDNRISLPCLLLSTHALLFAADGLGGCNLLRSELGGVIDIRAGQHDMPGKMNVCDLGATFNQQLVSLPAKDSDLVKLVEKFMTKQGVK